MQVAKLGVVSKKLRPEKFQKFQKKYKFQTLSSCYFSSY